MKKNKTDRILIMFLAVMVLITGIMTSSYAPKKRSHMCCGNKCATCQNIKAAAELSNGVVMAPVKSDNAVSFLIKNTVKAVSLLDVHATLVTLNVLILS